MLENTSSLMLMGYLVRAKEEQNKLAGTESIDAMMLN